MRKISSKIMLFGEYLILTGGDALTKPLGKYSGVLSFDMENRNRDYIAQSSRHLRGLFDYLKTVNHNLNYPVEMEQFDTDLVNGIYFDSNIPMKSGLGSSGAICAAIYDHYSVALNSYNSSMLDKVCDDLKLIESHFHLKSSGLDPLTCYLNKPLFVSNSKVIPLNMSNDSFRIFLVDTGKTGDTASGVRKFRELLKDQAFYNHIQCDLIPYSNEMIGAFRRNQPESFFHNFDIFIQHQIQYYPDIIEKKYREIISDGSSKNLFRMKVCGSGGGGFLIGFTQNIQETDEYFQDLGEQIIVIE